VTDTVNCVVTCGDTIINPGEECDDGNSFDGDMCSDECFIEVCGGTPYACDACGND